MNYSQDESMTREQAIKRAKELYPFEDFHNPLPIWNTVQEHRREAYLKGWEESQNHEKETEQSPCKHEFYPHPDCDWLDKDFCIHCGKADS